MQLYLPLCMVQKLFVSQKKQISDLQTEENKAFRYTVNARKCTAISALRGEMGASLQTRCTRGDARSFFCTYKTYLYAQN